MANISFKNFFVEDYHQAKLNDIEKTLFKTRGNYKIYLVDDFAVRNASKALQEFSNFGTHLQFPDEIPENEIWLASSYDNTERKFYIEEIFKRLHLMKQGIDKDTAYDMALKFEKEHRNKIDSAKIALEKTHKQLSKECIVGTYCHCKQENVDIVFVDGRIIRDVYKTDYVEGGHGYVYPWCPTNMIVIEYLIKAAEVKPIVLHELSEMIIMRDYKLDYEVAHDIAANIEYEFRESGKGLDLELTLDKELLKKATL